MKSTLKDINATAISAEKDIFCLSVDMYVGLNMKLACVCVSLGFLKRRLSESYASLDFR